MGWHWKGQQVMGPGEIPRKGNTMKVGKKAGAYVIEVGHYSKQVETP